MIGPTLAYVGLSSCPRLVSGVHGFTAMVMGGVLVYIGQGPMQIEMRFYFFVLIALLAVFGNPIVIVFVAIESVAACFVARSFFDNVIGLTRIVTRRTANLDERNREMRIVFDNVAQGFVMIDVEGQMATERSAIVDVWFGTPPPATTFVAYIEPHAAEFAAWFEFALSTLRDGYMPTELCMAQMPKRFAIPGRAFEVSCRTIMGGTKLEEGTKLERILVIISDVTAQIVRERTEREQRELPRHVPQDHQRPRRRRRVHDRGSRAARDPRCALRRRRRATRCNRTGSAASSVHLVSTSVHYPPDS